MIELFVVFIFFFVVIDLIGMVFVFIVVICWDDVKFKCKVVFKVVGVLVLVLFFFVIVGELLLNVIKIFLLVF